MSYTAGFRAYWKPAGSWVEITSHIKQISGNLELAGDKSNALAFGDSSTIACAMETLDLSLQATAYDGVPAKVDFTIAGNEQRGFTGIITGRERAKNTMAFQCEGYKRTISRTRIHSPMFERRPAATKTTATSIENPAVSNYAGGLINYALWQSGGRPLEQIATYPTATFYYSVPEYAILSPDYAWLAGEDTWDECLKLARASGGQLYQDRSGTIVYKQPLSFGNGTALYTFDENMYGDLKEAALTDQAATKVICPVIPRTKQLVQTVIEDSTPRRIPGGVGQTLTITLEPQNPIAANGWLLVAPTTAIPRYQLPADAIRAVFGSGSVPTVNVHYGYTVATAAQQIVLVFTNKTAWPITVSNLIIKGAPVVAGETETVTSVSVVLTDPEKYRTMTLPDNPYIQTRSHGQRIADMTIAFSANALPLITASDCLYDPDRYVGESVNLARAAWGLSATKHLIVAKRDSKTGTRADYDMVSVAGLPYSDQFFTVGPTHWAGTVKRLGY
jgi:hypothetical protein